MSIRRKKKSKYKKYYCMWCDTLVNSNIEEYDDKENFVWAGCEDCYKKRKEIKQNERKRLL